MLVYWHTFDVNRLPIWYFAGPQQWNTDGTWGAPLKKVQWIPGNGSPTITDVGNVAFTRLIQAPTKLALRWQLSDQTGNQTGIENECIHDFSRDAGVPGRANTTYTGQWYEPNFEGYGLSFNIQEYPGRFEEVVLPEVYDSTGAPTWLIGQRPNATASPPPNTSESYPLLYVYTNYPGGIPTAASSSCATTSTCFSFVSGAGTFMREFSSTIAGTWRISIANYFNAPLCQPSLHP